MADAATDQPWGASPADWTHLAERLGLLADLLPVVSNPDATISPSSKLRDLGKTPSRYDVHGQVVGIPKWTQHQATERDVQRWSASPDLGVCVQTRRVRAIDVDIGDQVKAREVLELLGLAVALPMRRRANSGKCLLVFDMPGEFAKRIIRTADGIIEFLATGQQFIAVGTHPSGARYEWSDADGVLGLPECIPELSPDEFEAIWQGLADAFALPGGETRGRNGLAPVVARRASDSNDPAVVWMSEHGWITELGDDGRVDVRCPWGDGHSTDSGPSSTSYFPAGVGGFAQGHFRCLHASCAGRTDGDFFEAIGYSADGFEVVEAQTDEAGVEVAPLPALERTPQGRPKATLNNVLAVLRRPDVCGMLIGRDRFNDELMVAQHVAPSARATPAWRLYTDDDHTRLRAQLTRAHNFCEVGRELMRDAVSLVASEQAFDSAQVWLSSLPAWDGVERCASFAERFLGAEPGAYATAVSLYLWTALAGRVMDPGCQADMALVLLGLQGTGKTRAVKALVPAPEHYVEINLAHRDDNLSRSLRGKLIGELGELRGLAGREAEDIKAWLSRRWEEWVPKYKEFATKFPRRLVFIGTSNEDQFLTDTTGNRRWLPLRTGVAGPINVAAIDAWRDQLWAEAVALWCADGVAWQEAESLARLVHKDHMATDSWEEAVRNWLDLEEIDGKPEQRKFLRTGEALRGAIGLNAAAQKKADQMRMGNVLRGMGYERKKVRQGAITEWVFVLSRSGLGC